MDWWPVHGDGRQQVPSAPLGKKGEKLDGWILVTVRAAGSVDTKNSLQGDQRFLISYFPEHGAVRIPTTVFF